MAVVEGQLERVLAGRFEALQADVELAVLEDRVAVALHFRRRRMHPEEFGAQAVALARGVFQLQGFRGFVQLDRGREAHRRSSGLFLYVGASLLAILATAKSIASKLAPTGWFVGRSFTGYTATDLRPAPARRDAR
ncbi:hypothetical protein D9M70_575070 [compost metagenome]